VLGNLDILDNAGRVAPTETDGVIKYSVTA
jgi:hypothetical protein